MNIKHLINILRQQQTMKFVNIFICYNWSRASSRPSINRRQK